MSLGGGNDCSALTTTTSANTLIGSSWNCNTWEIQPIPVWTYPVYPQVVYQPVYQPYPVPVETQRRNIMKVFNVLVIDKRECEVISEQTVVARDRETAMLDLDLDADIRDKIKKNEIEFIFAERGSFEKVERHAKVVEIKE